MRHCGHQPRIRAGGVQVAKRLGLLPQNNVVPEQLTVRDLVERGRYPHRAIFSPWTDADRDPVAEALGVSGTGSLAERYVDELSGGQRQCGADGRYGGVAAARGLRHPVRVAEMVLRNANAVLLSGPGATRERQ